MVTVLVPATRSSPAAGRELLATVSFLFPDGDVIRVRHGNEIQQTGHNHEFGSVIGGGKRDGSLSPIICQCEKVKPSRAHIANKAQNVENISAIRPIDAPLHREAKQKHGHNRNQQQEAANPTLLYQM